jgi:hypothetical protein
MGLTMKERQALVRETARRYQLAPKKQKSAILNEFVQVTHYHRVYAGVVLKNHGRPVKGVPPGLDLVGDIRAKPRGKRPRRYDDRVFVALKSVWEIMDYLCGKRLAPALAEVIPRLERFGEIALDSETRTKLLAISASTIDRLLAPERKVPGLKGRSFTKPGSLLKHQIPIKTFADWDQTRPGFVEIDLVGHEGGNSSGDFLQSLDVTDVCTGWTEVQAVRNKARVWVFEALCSIRKRLPFALLGIDSDNGGEFINEHLFHYCLDNELTFTRGRSSRKNDNCYVEQKNYSVVRYAVGYARYDTEEEMAILNELYSALRLYTNFFQPVMKLKEKIRDGAHVSKKHGKARTPFQRVLDCPFMAEKEKEALREHYETLNPAALKRTITALQNQLLRIVRNKREPKIKPRTAPSPKPHQKIVYGRALHEKAGVR